MARIAEWQDKHTAWNSWDDLSRRELFRLYSWSLKRQRREEEEGGGGAVSSLPFRAGATATPEVVVLTWVQPGSAHRRGNMDDLQLVRRLVRRLGQRQVHWCCVVEMLHYNRMDPLTHGNEEHNFHAKMAVDMVRDELSHWHQVQCDILPATTEMEARMHINRCVKSMAWSQAGTRIVIPVTPRTNFAHKAALQRGLRFHAYANYDVQDWPVTAREAHEVRHAASFRGGGELYLLDDRPLPRAELLRRLGLAGGGPRAARRRVKLWLFYMDDEPPSAAQLQSDRHLPIPFPQNPQGTPFAPGEAMGFFVRSFVQPRAAAGGRRSRVKGGGGGALHVVLAPHLTAGSLHKVSRNVTIMSLKGCSGSVQSLLRHCEDWVGCEGVHTLAECCRAGKRVFFRHRNQTELNAWNQYKTAVSEATQNGEIDYRHMVEKTSKKKLLALGQGYSSSFGTLALAV